MPLSTAPPPVGPWRSVASVCLQAAGAAAALLSTWLVTRSFGVEAQGRFGLLKGWSDALATVLMVGLPQALLHLSHQDQAASAGLLRFAWRFSVGCALAALALAAVLAWQAPVSWLVAPLLAAPAYVLHGLLRALILRPGGPWVYALVSVLPALSLLVGLAGLSLTGRPAWGAVLVGSALVSAAGAVLLLAQTGQGWRGAKAPLPPALWHTNRHAFVQNVAAALQVALLLTVLQAAGATAVGEVSLALVFLQVFAALAGFVAPLVYQRAVAAPARLPPTTRAGLALLAGLVPVLAWWWLPTVLAWFMPAGQAAGRSLQGAALGMVVAGLLLLGNRVVATVLQARGEFAELTQQALFRLLSSLALAWVFWRVGQPAVVSAALGLMATELLLGVRCALLVRRVARAPGLP